MIEEAPLIILHNMFTYEQTHTRIHYTAAHTTRTYASESLPRGDVTLFRVPMSLFCSCTSWLGCLGYGILASILALVVWTYFAWPSATPST